MQKIKKLSKQKAGFRFGFTFGFTVSHPNFECRSETVSKPISYPVSEGFRSETIEVKLYKTLKNKYLICRFQVSLLFREFESINTKSSRGKLSFSRFFSTLSCCRPHPGIGEWVYNVKYLTL